MKGARASVAASRVRSSDGDAAASAGHLADDVHNTLSSRFYSAMNKASLITQFSHEQSSVHPTNCALVPKKLNEIKCLSFVERFRIAGGSVQETRTEVTVIAVLKASLRRVYPDSK